MPFNISNLYNSIARLGVTSFLKNLNRNALVVFESTPSGLRTTTGVNRASGDRAFIVGFIPPDVTPNFIPVKSAEGELLKASFKVPKASGFNVSSTALVSELPKVRGLEENTSAAFRSKLARVAAQSGIPAGELAALMVIETDGKYSPSIQNKSTGATGLIQFMPSTAKDLGTTTDDLAKLSAYQQLDYVAKFLQPGKQKKWKKPGDSYLMVFYPVAVGQEDGYVIGVQNSTEKVGKTTRGEIYKLNSGLDYDKNGTLTAGDVRNKLLDVLKAGESKGFIPISYADEASEISPVNAAAKASPVQETVGIMAGNMVAVGENFDDPYQQQGRYLNNDDIRLENAKIVVKDISDQIDLVSRTPSLMMLINPKSFNRSYEQTVDVTGGWRGQIVSMWLEKPLRISGSGTSAVQYALDSNGGGGITNVNRVFSLSYENLMSLSLFYRNNGWLYTGETYDASNIGVPTLACSVFIYYDGHIYIGSFDSFRIEESVDGPFVMNYSFDFTARYDLPLIDSLGEANLAGAIR